MNLRPSKKELQNLWVYLIPLLTSVLFFYKLGEISFWGDELVTYRTVFYKNYSDFLQTYFANQLHPPLYFVAIRVQMFFVEWAQFFSYQLVFGFAMLFSLLNGSLANFSYPDILSLVVKQNFFFAAGGANEFSLRLLPAIAMLFTNLAVFQFFKKQNLIWVAIGSSLLMGTNLCNIYYAHEARPYTLFSFFFVLTMREFVLYYEGVLPPANRKRLFILNVLMLLTHYYAVFVILTELLVAAAREFKKSPKSAVKLIVGFGGLTSVLLAFIFKLKLDAFGYLEALTLSELPQSLTAALDLETTWLTIVCVVGLLAIKRVLKKWSKVDRIALMLLVFTAILCFLIAVVSAIRPIFIPRYIVFITPLAMALLACLMWSLLELLLGWIKDLQIQKTVMVIYFLVFVTAAAASEATKVIVGQNFFGKLYKENYPLRQAAEMMVGSANGQKVYYVMEDYFSHIYSYYDQKFNLNQITLISSDLPRDQKIKQTLDAIRPLDLEQFFYLKVKKQKQDDGAVNISHFKKEIIMVNNRMTLLKFTREH